MVEAIPPPPFH